jgi:hypothetical protein
MMDLTTTPEQWLQRAAQATDSLDFDVCVSRGLPFFQGDLGRVEAAREGMFGEWNPAQAEAALAGLRAYITKRTELEAAGLPTQSAHKSAKEKGRATFHRELERVMA